MTGSDRVPCPKPARPRLTFGNLPATLNADKRIGSHCSLFVKRQRGDGELKHGRLASRMGRSCIGWALSVAAPWCVAFAVLVSITAEAEQEPTELTSTFARGQLMSTPSGLDRAFLSGRPPRAVDEDGAPLPIVLARTMVGDPDALAAGEAEIQPNGALKPTGRAFPAVDRGAKGDPVFSAPGVNAKRLNGKRSAAEPMAQVVAARVRRSAQHRIRSRPYDEPSAPGRRR